MKKVVCSAIAMVALSGVGFAGGDMAAVVEPVVAVPEVEESLGIYAGLALSAVSTRGASVDLDFFDSVSGQDRLGNATLLGGYELNEYIAAEGRYTTSVDDLHSEDISEMDGWSLFFKPQYPVTEQFRVYGLLGFGGVTLDSVNPAFSVDVDDSGFQWGVGMSYALNEYIKDYDLSIFVDYTSLANDMEGVYFNGDTEIDVDAITVGVALSF